jgi:TPR repeat protein
MTLTGINYFNINLVFKEAEHNPIVLCLIHTFLSHKIGRYKKAILEKTMKASEKIKYSILGQIYHIGYGVDKDCKKAKEYFQKAIDANDSYGLVYMGEMYCNIFESKDDDDDDNVQKAFRYANEFYCDKCSDKIVYKESSTGTYCNNCNKDVRLHIHMDYDKYDYMDDNMCNDCIIPQDYKKAFEYFNEAKQLDNPFAYFNIAEMHRKNYYVQNDSDIIKEYYEKSVKLGNHNARTALALLYNNNDGYACMGNNIMRYNLPDQFDRATKWNNPLALYYSGKLYLDGDSCIDKDRFKAMQHLHFSMQLSNPYAHIKLGMRLTMSDIFTKVKLYEISARLGSKFATKLLKIAKYKDILKKLKTFEALMDDTKEDDPNMESVYNEISKNDLEFCALIEKNFIKKINWRKD